MKKIRTRFAPSPTGMLHIGGIRTALYNYLFSKKFNGDFILRIEDTDRTRFVNEAQDYIFESLKWLKILPNEGFFNGGPHKPYLQSERKNIYKKYAEILIEKGFAYYAFDTKEELFEMHKRLSKLNITNPQYNSTSRSFMKNSLTLSKKEIYDRISRGDNYVIRFKIPEKETIRFHDIVRGWISINSSTLDDKILIKSDGMATYHLASIVDDYLMEISHVIRGEEWLPSAPLHVLMYKAFGWEKEMPEFVHLPLLLKPDGQGKLSKRDADKEGFPIFPLSWYDKTNNRNVIGFREKGYLPEAIINSLVLLGWNPGNNKEIFSVDELIESFSLERLIKSGARFNIKKFNWFNHEYIKKKDNFYFIDVIKTNFKIDEKFYENEEKLNKICNLIKDRSFYVNDIVENAKMLLEKPKEYEEIEIEKNKIEFAVKWIEKYLDSIIKVDNNSDLLHDILKKQLEEDHLSFKDIMPTFRLIVFGKISGPDVIETISILGIDEINERISTFKNKQCIKMPT